MHRLPGDQQLDRAQPAQVDDESAEEELWTDRQDDGSFTGTQQVRTDGALALAPLSPGDAQRNTHAATYRCCLMNQFGRLCSRPVRTRAGKFIDLEPSFFLEPFIDLQAASHRAGRVVFCQVEQTRVGLTCSFAVLDRAEICQPTGRCKFV